MRESESVPEQIAGALEEMVRERVWRVGERVASIRETARSFQVSPTTVAEAYRLLVSRGVLRSKPRSGYYVCRAGWQAPSVTRSQALPLEPRQVRPLSMLRRMAEVRERAGMVELGSALPAASLLPHRELARATRRVLARSSTRFLGLEPSLGAPELRRELSRHLLGLGLVVGPEELFVTVGATEAMHLALGASCRPGDVVALGSPNYYGFFQVLEAMGLRALELPADPDEGMDPRALRDALERGVSVRAVLVCPTVSNPLGATMSASRCRELVSLCADHDITIVEDVTYADLRFEPTRRRVLEVPAGLRVVRVGSMSKALAPGFRVGWCVPGVYRDRVRALKVTTTYASPTPTALIVAEVMRDRAYDRHLESLRETFQRLVGETRAMISEVFPAQTRVSTPKGGHVLWVELAGVDTAALFERCVSNGVSFAPGALFSNTDAFSSCLRINAALEWTEPERAALEHIGARSIEMSLEQKSGVSR